MNSHHLNGVVCNQELAVSCTVSVNQNYQSGAIAKVFFKFIIWWDVNYL